MCPQTVFLDILPICHIVIHKRFKTYKYIYFKEVTLKFLKTIKSETQHFQNSVSLDTKSHS